MVGFSPPSSLRETKTRKLSITFICFRWGEPSVSRCRKTLLRFFLCDYLKEKKGLRAGKQKGSACPFRTIVFVRLSAPWHLFLSDIGRTEKGKTCVQSLAKNDAALLLASQIKKPGHSPRPPSISRIRKGLISFIEEIPNFLSALEKMYGLSARFPIYHKKRGKDNGVSF